MVPLWVTGYFSVERSADQIPVAAASMTFIFALRTFVTEKQQKVANHWNACEIPSSHWATVTVYGLRPRYRDSPDQQCDVLTMNTCQYNRIWKQIIPAETNSPRRVMLQWPHVQVSCVWDACQSTRIIQCAKRGTMAAMPTRIDGRLLCLTDFLQTISSYFLVVNIINIYNKLRRLPTATPHKTCFPNRCTDLLETTISNDIVNVSHQL